MGKYTITPMMSINDILDEDDNIPNDAIEYLLERHNTLSEVESILASCNRSRYCLKAATDDVDDLSNEKFDDQNTITLLALMNVMNELVYYQTACEQQSEDIDEVIDDNDEEEGDNEYV